MLVSCVIVVIDMRLDTYNAVTFEISMHRLPIMSLHIPSSYQSCNLS